MTFETTGWDASNILEKRMRIDNFGKVSIATTSPSARLHVSGTITEDSDERLKKNIRSLGPTLDKISQLRGVSFEWKDREEQDGRTHLGVIAREVEEVFPELVFTSDDEEGTKAVNYDGFIAPLIEAVKELKAENDALKAQAAQIEALKAIICQDHPTLVRQYAKLLIRYKPPEELGIPGTRYLIIGKSGRMCDIRFYGT